MSVPVLTEEKNNGVLRLIKQENFKGAAKLTKVGSLFLHVGFPLGLKEQPVSKNKKFQKCARVRV